MSKPSNEKVIEPLQDPVAERTLISSLINLGDKVFFDIDTYVKETDFFRDENRIVYNAISDLIVNQATANPSPVSIIGWVNKNSPNAIQKYLLDEYIMALSKQTVHKEDVQPFIKVLAKLSLARKLRESLSRGVSKLNQLTGKESPVEILTMAEGSLSNIDTKILDSTNPIQITDKLGDYVKYLETEKPSTGIASGFPIWDKYIGGGLRPGVHLVGARSGGGKSFLAVNVADSVANQTIKVLYLDTELTPNMTRNRLLSLASAVTLDDIEGLKFINNPASKKQLEAACSKLEKSPFYYHNISGAHYKEWISIMRRWIINNVGLQKNGKPNPCLIILDYIKMMDIESLGAVSEWQYLGQIITDLHNFTIKYDLPILSLVQLNRDGIEKEDQSAIAGSDRLIHLCSSFTIMKPKSEEDYAADPDKNGNKKLVIAKARFGSGTSFGEYINLKADLSIAKITEGNTNISIRNNKKVAFTNNNTNVAAVEESPPWDEHLEPNSIDL